jgi:O-antigen/teichoic acid export membrane protein
MRLAALFQFTLPALVRPGAEEAAGRWRSDSTWKFVDLASMNASRLLATILFARRLGLEEFGVYALGVMVVGVAVTATNLGLPTAAARFLGTVGLEHHTNSELILRRIGFLRLVTGVPALALFVVMLWFLSSRPNWGFDAAWIAILSAYFVIQSAAILIEYAAAGLALYRAYVSSATLLRETS